MTKNNTKGCLILALTALIWGTAFIAQRTGMVHIEPFTFTFCRSLLGAAVLFPVSLIVGRKKDKALPLRGYKSKNSLLQGFCRAFSFLRLCPFSRSEYNTLPPENLLL